MAYPGPRPAPEREPASGSDENESLLESVARVRSHKVHSPRPLSRGIVKGRHLKMATMEDVIAQASPDLEPGQVGAEEISDEVLRIRLDSFEGPFEILLYLIKTQEIDIFDIPIVTITDQYLRFLELMQEEDLDVAGEYLVMAATLIQIKSKMLLPVEMDEDDEEEADDDPRMELVEKLIAYRLYRQAASQLELLESDQAGRFQRNVKPEFDDDDEEETYLELSLYDLGQAFKGVLRFFSEDLFHTVELEGASVDDKIDYIRGLLESQQSVAWADLFKSCNSRVELICAFLAILELCRMGIVRAHQHSTFGDIRLFPARQTSTL